MGLFELSPFSDKQKKENKESIIKAAENMYQTSRATDNMILRNSPMDAKSIKLLKRSIAHKHGATTLTKRLGSTRPSEIAKMKLWKKAKRRMAA